MWKTVCIFILGCLIGIWMSSLDKFDPNPEECISVCVEQFERFGC